MNEAQRLVPIERRVPERMAASVPAVTKLERDDSDTYFYLRAYWHILLKRRWTVLTVAFVLTTLVAIISFKMQPVYQAVARLEIEAETPQIQSLSDLDRSMPSDEAFVETQVRIIQTDNLAWRTIEQLWLAEKPAFARSIKGRESDPGSLATVQARLIKEFTDRLKVERVRDSRLVEVKFESTDPQLAVQVVNALVQNYIEANFRKRYDATRQASGWMEQQLDELKAKVERSQQAMVDYERQNTIVNISDKQNVVEQQLADLSRDLTNAQSERLEKESLYNLIRVNEEQVAFLAQNELLQRLEEKHADFKTQYVDALGQYGPNFPKVIRLRDQVNEIQSLIDRERKRIVSRIRNDYLAAVGREKLLAAAVAQQKAEVGRLNQLLIQHNILKREFETNQQLYENLLRRLKDATVSAGLRATNIHVVDTALLPSIPVRPKKLLNIAIGLLVGMILGVTLAFVEEGLDNSVKSAEDVEKLIAVPTLAIVPEAALNGGRPSWLRRLREPKPSADGAVELTVLKQPSSLLAESFRSLRTAILLSMAPRPPQAILVTSPQPNEGKTCTALNLTLALAQRGARVLIVDADLRKPGIARPLGLSEERGLSSILTGAHSLEEVLYQLETLPNLWVMPAGLRPPNPAELLCSSSMGQLLERLRQMFQHVIVDSPPSLMVTDATILSSLVDGTILVAQPGVTTRAALARAHKLLESAGARVMGVVLNRVSSRNSDLDYYYGYYHSRYYRSYFEDDSKPTPLEARASPTAPHQDSSQSR